MAKERTVTRAFSTDNKNGSFGIEALQVLDQSVLEAIPAAVYACAADGVIARYNSKAVELWGRAPKPGDTDERYCGAFQLHHLDGRPLPHDKTPMEVALRTGEPQRDKEVTIERPDGSRIVALVNIEPLKGPDGVEGAINCFQDITERKRIEEKLAQNSSDLEDFFENAPVAMHWVAGDGTILRANQAELDFLGYTREEYIGRHITEFHADQSRIDQILGCLTRGEAIDRVPAQLRARDGTIKPVQISSSTHFRDGEFANTRCVTLDMSLDQAHQRLAAIVESSDDAIISKDLNGNIVSWNQGAERLFGYAPEEAIGNPITMLMAPEQQAEEPEILARIRRGERVDHYETVRLRKDGSVVDISLTVSPVKDNTGKVVGASKIARNISERKRAEEQRNLLMRELSHRSKNLLALVQGIMRQSIMYAEDMEDFEADFGERLQGLARLHDLLIAQEWRGAPIDEVVRSQLSIVDGGASVTADGPKIVLTPAAAQSLAMAFHELTTNAVKHGALSVPEGRVKVDWSITEKDDPFLTLAWTESDGPRVEPPARKGVGSRVLEEIVAHSFDGKASVTFRPEGLRWEFEAPISHLCSRIPPVGSATNGRVSPAAP